MTSSEFANCEDNLNILTISSAGSSRQMPSEESTEAVMVDMEFEGNYLMENDESVELLANEALREEELLQNISSFDSNIKTKEDATVAFFAGSVEIRLQSKRFDCQHCQFIFNENEKVEGIFFENNKTQKPCKSTYLICRYTHKFISEKIGKVDFDYHGIMRSTLNSVRNSYLFSRTNFSHIDGYFHKQCFVKDIIDEYVRIYATYVARRITLEQQQIIIRNRNKRITIFNGQ